MDRYEKELIGEIVNGNLSAQQRDAIKEILKPGDTTDSQECLLVNQAQASRILNCSRFTVRRLVQDGELHPVAVRGLTRFRLSEIRAFAEGK